MESPGPTGEVPWTILHAVMLLAAYHVVQAPVAVAVGLLLIRSNILTANLTAASVSCLAALGLVAIVLKACGRRRPLLDMLALRRPRLCDLIGTWRVVLVGAAVYACVALTVVVVFEALGLEPQQQLLAEEISKASSSAVIVFAAFIVVVAAPVIEEILFRAVLYLPLRKRFGAVRACLIVGAVFAAVHLYPPGLLQLFVLSIVLVALFERTRSLCVPIGAHALYNLVNFVLLRVGPPPS